MKTFLYAIVFVLTMPVAAHGFEFSYVFAGASTAGEDADALVGDGVGWRVGLGTAFSTNNNYFFGEEVIYDTTEAIGPIPALIDTDAQEIEGNTSSNTYLSFLGTCAYPFNDCISVMGKAGLSRYTVDVELIAAKTRLSYDEVDYDEIERFLVKEDGLAPMVSGSLILTLNDNNAVDFSVSKMFGDFGTTSFSLNFLYLL
ncbi:MAG: hypothetical protein F4077_02820 [Gammaproteobacteria bacterium]|nr:hypothetical protein [Gammaproteobacteria bacterium]MYI76684.1 hypothetical protein [Gammaproteobacteria bacterium]